MNQSFFSPLANGEQISAYVQDSIYRVFKRRNNGVGCPEFRLPLMLPSTLLLPLGFFLYGWTAEHHTHWILPNIGAFIYAAGIMIGFNALMMYVVDCYQTYAASATAATSVLRCIAAFLLPLFAPSMYNELGNGWGNSVLAFIAVAIGGAGARPAVVLRREAARPIPILLKLKVCWQLKVAEKDKCFEYRFWVMGSLCVKEGPLRAIE